MNEKEYQVAYQVEQLQKILESIDAQLNEVVATKESLEEIKKLKGTEQILFPVANGIFAKGKLSDSKILRMNVGNNVVVEKTVDDAIEMMQRQYSEIDEYRIQLSAQLESLLKELQE